MGRIKWRRPYRQRRAAGRPDHRRLRRRGVGRRENFAAASARHRADRRGIFLRRHRFHRVRLAGSVHHQSKFRRPAADAAAIGSATIFGLFIGTAGQGEFSDRFGRRFIYQFNLLLFGIFTILGAFAPSVTLLIVCRFIAGIGLGAEQPLCLRLCRRICAQAHPRPHPRHRAFHRRRLRVADRNRACARPRSAARIIE